MDGSQITIRKVEKIEHFRQCQDIQKQVWGFTDVQVIPFTQLMMAQKNGGIVLAAFDGDNLVAFVYGFMAMWERRLYLYSQRMGVLPHYQRQGIGYRLKLAQRNFMLTQGIDLIIWTFDALEGPNANLNIEKLGTIVRTYERDIYGPVVESTIHAGLNTDRFLSEWRLMSQRVREHLSPGYERPDSAAILAAGNIPSINRVTWNEDGWIEPGEINLALTGDKLLVEVPPHLQALKQDDLELAQEWREKSRLVFEHYFTQGYAVTGFATGMVDLKRRNLYILEPQDKLGLLGKWEEEE
jgi:predicted GNAT superfamily acetyltransferase